MARVIWSGALAFGLVNIPIGLYAATEDRTVHFNQFQKGTSDRIRYKRVNERTGEEVPFKEIVKGREVDEDTYVLVTDDELESVEPGRTRTIDITDFVDLSEVDPIYFQKTYYLAPRGMGPTARTSCCTRPCRPPTGSGSRPWSCGARNTWSRSGPRRRSWPWRPCTSRTRSAIRSRAPATSRPGARPNGEVTIARQLIESMTTDWDPERYHDTYRERVEELIESKRNGEEIEAAAPAPRESKVVDLTEMLRQSVEQAKGKKNAQPPARQSQSSRGSRSAPESRPSQEDEQDLSDMSKTQLAQLAGELEISGRSKMTRDDLEQAIRKARRPRAVS